MRREHPALGTGAADSETNAEQSAAGKGQGESSHSSAQPGAQAGPTGTVALGPIV